MTDEPIIPPIEQVKESPLLKLGYRVGVHKGIPEAERRIILGRSFLKALPFVDSEEYMEGWSEPKTRLRLRRLAWHIAMLVRAHRTKHNFGTAVREWERDLAWLKLTYYKPLMRFIWP